MHVTSSPLVQQICDGMPQDSFSHDIRQQLNDYKSFDPENHLNNFQFKNGLLYYKDLLYMFQVDPFIFKFFKQDMIYHRSVILALIKPWNLFLVIFGGLKCGNW
jgi:hypothetical protein